MRRFALLLTVLGSVSVTVILASSRPAHATFPGANGKIAFASDQAGNIDIYAINPNGTGSTQLTTNPATDTRPAWSPDGTKIAFVSFRDGNAEIYVMNANGTNQTRLTNDPAGEGRPSWSPDGQTIAFHSNRTGDFEIWVMNADGTNPTRVTDVAGVDIHPRYHPDGGRILFTHSVDDGTNGPLSLWTVHTNGKNTKQLTEDSLQAGGGDWSPAADRIVFASNYCFVCPSSDIYVINPGGQHLRQLTTDFGNNLDPKWSPDGTKITFSHEDPPVDFTDQQIFTMNSDGSGKFNVTSNTANNFAPDWGVP